MKMFCYQCEQTARGKGCDMAGVCGKQSDTAGLQDLLVYQLKGIGYLAHRARSAGVTDDEVNRFTVEALFATITNVNFDNNRFDQWVRKAATIRSKIAMLNKKANPGHDTTGYPAAATFEPSPDHDTLLQQAAGVGLMSYDTNEDLRSLKHILLYGLKGMAAYADHAYLLGKQDDQVFTFFHEALAELDNSHSTVDRLFELCMRCGSTNIKTMELLDNGHTTRFGHPQPTPVSTSLKEGLAIVISGHDLIDLEALLQQTDGKGINIYTHGEMLPAHGYPQLKKYRHLAGHFGTAWQNQQKEFDNVPAAFLFTTNCIQKPRDSYKDRVFTCGLVGWPDVAHIDNRDFTPVIEKALSLGGLKAREGGTLLTGCAHNAVLSLADKVIDAVKSGAIRHFFLVGGCDGAKPGRNYYTELAESIPKDCMILTLACGKFRFNHLDFGTINGLPRLLDIGQCNDSYSAIKIAQALAGAFNCTVNELPLSLILSWYEQKAVVVLLSLLSLGIKGIRLGPSLPAFITPNVLNVLVDKFDIKPISTVKDDLSAILK